MASSENTTAGVIAPPPVIALATLVVGLLLDWLLPAYVLTVLFDRDTRWIVAAILLVIGCVLGFAAIFGFRRARTHVEPWKPALELVTGGIYRYLRNPMYVGLAFCVAAVAFALASDWTLVLMVPAAALMHYGVVLREERYLAARFGEAYRAYMGRVPRYGWPG